MAIQGQQGSHGLWVLRWIQSVIRAKGHCGQTEQQPPDAWALGLACWVTSDILTGSSVLHRPALLAEAETPTYVAGHQGQEVWAPVAPCPASPLPAGPLSSSLWVRTLLGRLLAV